MFTGSRLVLLAAVLLACEEPPAQDASQTQITYQNGYAQTTPSAPGARPQAPVTYSPTAPAATTPATTAVPSATAPAPTSAAPAPIQTTPVPVGVQALPPPAGATGAAPTKPVPSVTHKTMAVPGPGAFTCQSDAQCLLGRCNTLYGRCAYPCKNSEIDCKPNNVCTAAGLCMPRAGGGLGM